MSINVVAIGASAGGIEAITRLIGSLKNDTGWAYVIIQHLSAVHESILPELIERKTSMPVYQVTDGMKLEPDTVYVIPPNALMNIDDGHLKLSPHSRADGNSHTVDFFLTGLADVYKERAIAVILSGTAADGTEGVRAIKEGGGITFAQDSSAKFMGMPHNAIDSGFVDLVLAPEEIAKEITELSRATKNILPPEKMEEEENAELKKIYTLIHTKYNVDFTQYKPNTIIRRIYRRMNLNKVSNPNQYFTLLSSGGKEIDLLYQDLLISVTSFFRDPELYITLVERIFPELLNNRHPSEALRIWIPACASGEEACSIAISLFEYLGHKALITPIQIFATDLSESAIQKARTGIYSKSNLDNLSPERLAKFFIKLDGSYQVIKPIRDVCIYATHNLLSDPPFSRMDIISCQNVMIYLGPVAQQKILQSFHYALKPMGYLLLGKSEGVSNSNELFVQSGKVGRIFTKTSKSSNLKFDFAIRSPLHLPGSVLTDNKTALEDFKNEVNIAREVDRLLLVRFAPASVVINRDLHIVRFNGDTSNYFQPAAGKASLHILKMVKDEIMFELRSLINKARKNNSIVKKDFIPITINNGPAQLSIEINPIKISGDHFLIVFQEKTIIELPVSKGKKGSGSTDHKDTRIQQLESQLTECKEQIKLMAEEFELNRQLLQSAHEDVLSSNEELQSINEELETSKEELQSTNEELTTINEEIQRRVEDLKDSVNYSEGIIETMHGPLLVLNDDMCILTANRAFLTQFKVKKETVYGHRLYEISEREWNISELKEKLNEIIAKNKGFANFELTHTFHDVGKKILLFNAMRMEGNDKVKPRYLIAIEDITERKRAEELSKANEERLNLVIQNTFDIITILSAEGNITYESESIEEILGYKTSERLEKNIFIDAIVHPEDKHLKETMFKNSLAQPGVDIWSEFRLMHKNGTYRFMEAVCINLLDDYRVNGIIAHYRDITERRMLEKQKEQFIGIASHELKTPVTSIKGYAQILEQSFALSNDKPSLELIRKMDVQINRLTSLIKDLLDVTRISEGQLKLQRDDFDINHLITEVVEEIQQVSLKHTIIQELQPVTNIVADREKIRQVIVNLLSNAIKYSPASDKVIIRSGGDGETLHVSVEDFGIGMSEASQPRVFERFYRDNDPAITTYPGLGLGLYIAAEIIRKEGGTISLKSEKDIGSEFYFTMPVKK